MIVGAAHSLGDAIATMIFAAVVLNASAFGLLVLLLVHLWLAIAPGSQPRGWKRLAIAWWVVGLLSFLGAAILIAPTPPARERGLDAVFFVAPLFAGLMGGLAAWTGARAEGATPALRRARTVNVAIPTIVLASAAAGLLWSWHVYGSRVDRIEAEDAEARARESQAAAEELARLEASRAKLEEERAAIEHERAQAEAARQRCRDLAAAFDRTRHDDVQDPLFVPLDDAGDTRAAPAGTDAFERRLADGALTRDDVGPDDPPLPCLAEERSAVLGAYARGLARLELWTLDVQVSPLASEALAEELDGAARWNLLRHIDGLALAAARRGRPDELASALRLCALAKTLDRDPIESRAIFSRGGCRRAARAE